MLDELMTSKNVDQIVFMGANNIQTVRFNLMYSQPGEPGFSTLYYGEPYGPFRLFHKDKMATSIENHRIVKQIIDIEGKRTLVCFADLNPAGGRNRSFMDMALDSLWSEMMELRKQLKYEIQHRLLMAQFLKDQHIESTWEEWIINKGELLNVFQKRFAPRVLTEAPQVQVSVEEQEKKKGK